MGMPFDHSEAYFGIPGQFPNDVEKGRDTKQEPGRQGEFYSSIDYVFQTLHSSQETVITFSRFAFRSAELISLANFLKFFSRAYFCESPH